MAINEFEELREITFWRTKDGEEKALEDMESSHLQNTIIYLTSKQEKCDELGLGAMAINGKKASTWIELMRTELKYREDPTSISTQDYPVTVPSGTSEMRITL